MDSCRCLLILTDLLGDSQVKEVQVALVAHLLVCGEHDDVPAEVEATRPDGGVGIEHSQLFTWAQKRISIITENTWLELNIVSGMDNETYSLGEKNGRYYNTS